MVSQKGNIKDLPRIARVVYDEEDMKRHSKVMEHISREQKEQEE